MYNPKLHFHFIGIGGSGMSGIAEVLLNLGFKVSGSDLHLSETCRYLANKGAQIQEGHSQRNLPDSASLVVYSSAVNESNPEVVEARHRGIPVIPRAEVLAELMRLKYGVAVAGSHGKTTTTSMVATILETAELDPTVIIGGRVKSMGSGGKLGQGEFLVAESDESDRSFLLLKPTIAIITNIDSEHMSAYSSAADLYESFQKFAESVPFYGLSIFCIDNPEVRKLSAAYTKRKVTYGLSPDAKISATNIAQSKNVTSYDITVDGTVLCHIDLPMPGEHILVNSLAAVAVALELQVSPEKICLALARFSGVARRLEIIGEGKGVTVISDYGHHPTEVKATLRAIQAGWAQGDNDTGRIHVIFQPHRYTRTRDCFVDFLGAFTDCDTLLITDIYAASEEPIAGITSETLVSAMTTPAVRDYIPTLVEASQVVGELMRPGDVVVFLGAGSIGAAAEQFVETRGFSLATSYQLVA